MAAAMSPILPAQANIQRPEGLDLYARFALAGALGCAITHAVFTPVDVVKTKIQLDPVTYNRGMIAGFRQLIHKEGAGALLTGLGPTFTGYFIQGGVKFGLYELFKKQSIEIIGLEKARRNRTAVYSVSAACAECCSAVTLCPAEATRIRLVSAPGFANGLIGGFSKILKHEGIGALYSGFGPILFKQVPYTVTKFVSFEKISEFFFSRLDNSRSGTTQLMINMGSGLISGCAAAVISQPADTMLSRINKTKAVPCESTAFRLYKIAGELGFRGSFAGLPARLFMIGGLTAGQFAIYGSIKSALGATNGVKISK
ncbi:mitochondrial phosphate carrier protein [Colletotrichum godetiae]|uniref:Mitochondrial phosphate carrier protein n=1 Tax=Colletotrichum godetiae TaxID=1209918 RepID=A0AAJ0EUK5_9PEZI|nr:mitochondrial phosphate carrier protein [Colletotrichum godetiae]KAK1676297.1 mitochondrial phosphate carrier protein [Colletotrichum godetiae]